MVLSDRLKKILPHLACPSCSQDLLLSQEYLECSGCSAKYPVKNNKIYFVGAVHTEDAFDKLKAFFKMAWGKYYYTIGQDILTPAYPFNFLRWIEKYMDPEQLFIIDAGCGSRRIHEKIICMDFCDYDSVDIVCDLNNIPLKPESVDAFVSRGLLEHVTDPKKVVESFYRCTKSGGMTLHDIPFLYPFHASPNDFFRFTYKGLEVLFSKWEIKEKSVIAGPVTTGLVCTVDCLSIVLSFGNKRLYAFLAMVLGAMVFPIKYLDFFFVNRKSFLPVASNIILVAQKDK